MIFAFIVLRCTLAVAIALPRDPRDRADSSTTLSSTADEPILALENRRIYKRTPAPPLPLPGEWPDGTEENHGKGPALSEPSDDAFQGGAQEVMADVRINMEEDFILPDDIAQFEELLQAGNAQQNVPVEEDLPGPQIDLGDEYQPTTDNMLLPSPDILYLSPIGEENVERDNQIQGQSGFVSPQLRNLLLPGFQSPGSYGSGRRASLFQSPAVTSRMEEEDVVRSRSSPPQQRRNRAPGIFGGIDTSSFYQVQPTDWERRVAENFFDPPDAMDEVKWTLFDNLKPVPQDPTVMAPTTNSRQGSYVGSRDTGFLPSMQQHNFGMGWSLNAYPIVQPENGPTTGLIQNIPQNMPTEGLRQDNTLGQVGGRRVIDLTGRFGQYRPLEETKEEDSPRSQQK
ncbi:hypothetical protein DRE_03974 [Drechslerella stenobrocha 248]|uniref:Uncharacterized protein n=1 Tax=Drechslerella stenobrocha 248 TaxID=1043628 RepID=W7HTK4_9PEZI|nr:hypothetical protein DRE_03974 [Drechslerella stenobrocha 248]